VAWRNGVSKESVSVSKYGGESSAVWRRTGVAKREISQKAAALKIGENEMKMAAKWRRASKKMAKAQQWRRGIYQPKKAKSRTSESLWRRRKLWHRKRNESSMAWRIGGVWPAWRLMASKAKKKPEAGGISTAQ
jgi:hypothetical protein